MVANRTTGLPPSSPHKTPGQMYGHIPEPPVTYDTQPSDPISHQVTGRPAKTPHK